MSKYHGKRKAKGKVISINREDNKSKIGEALIKLRNTEEEVRVLETPFGALKLSDDAMIAHSLKDKAVVFDLFSEMREEDDLEALLILFNKLGKRYPNEPFIHSSITDIYREQGKTEECDALIKKNFDKFKGFPSVDIDYAGSIIDDKGDVLYGIFGESLNLHEIYPEFEVFDSKIATDFYFLMTLIHKDRKDYETARKCAEVVGMIGDRKVYALQTMIDLAEKPWKKIRGFAIIGLILLLIIALIVGVIWAIVKFLQWIF